MCASLLISTYFSSTHNVGSLVIGITMGYSIGYALGRHDADEPFPARASKYINKLLMVLAVLSVFLVAQLFK